MSEDQSAQLIHSLLLLVLLASGLIFHFRNRLGMAVKYAGIWISVIMVMVLLYSYKHDFSDFKERLLSSLSPSTVINNDDGSISVKASQDGHFYINTEINGQSVRFMVDTGASDIVINKSTAEKIGIDLNRLQYINTYYTANGKVRGAPVRLESIKVGNYTINDIRASVNEADMNKSLLGMSFLNKLNGYEVKNDTLTLWP
ncbi:MAG: TIGR02281 family clan AA aspartic protease [Rickettsiales bacterium]|nr:TIGR02281 family clan AA aspartic protease [Pseudomonadota bacterium]MDA0967458.1 TIGR02281 family clan AA aspartic protease [Pseudomonadota bacterium]MDG4544174.1 TIGR02281 family clan AA aspartic protease [Rickettsiales bacterium]MDG4546355.1 TIGR02281 family clan AA aspartic protease [Rickettsiales bacterium]MDG4548498.1 TIGR02281 family clan AA aspartic protease [Rickettsiales bacterium]